MEIVTLEYARSNGLKKYFTGEPCSRGEISERRTSDKRCVGPECAKWQSVKNERKREQKKGNNISIAEASELRNKKIKSKIDDAEERRLEPKKIREAKTRAGCSIKQKASGKAYQEKHRESIAARHAAYYIANRQKLSERSKSYAEAHPESVAAAVQKLRAKRIKRVPCWHGELDDFAVKEAILLCKARKEATGLDWHVDHMIPMNAKKASGLHVWNNIQVIPAFLNLHKQNKMIMTEPMEWIGYLDSVVNYSLSIGGLAL